jgi:hypothetical protein
MISPAMVEPWVGPGTGRGLLSPRAGAKAGAWVAVEEEEAAVRAPCVRAVVRFGKVSIIRPGSVPTGAEAEVDIVAVRFGKVSTLRRPVSVSTGVEADVDVDADAVGRRGGGGGKVSTPGSFLTLALLLLALVFPLPFPLAIVPVMLSPLASVPPVRSTTPAPAALGGREGAAHGDDDCVETTKGSDTAGGGMMTASLSPAATLSLDFVPSLRTHVPSDRWYLRPGERRKERRGGTLVSLGKRKGEKKGSPTMNNERTTKMCLGHS